MKINRSWIQNMKLPKLKMRLRILLYFLTIVFGALSVVEAVHPYFYFALDIVIFVVAACGVTLSCYYLVYDLHSGISEKIKPVIENNSFANRLYIDYHYRTVFFTLFSFMINIFYAVSNGIYGIINHSAWLGTLSAYYIFLSIMRFSTVWHGRKQTGINVSSNLDILEWKVYRRCGVLLILITVALSGAVVLLVHKEGGMHYSGTLIFAVAAYTFYKIIISIINMIKAKKLNSPLLVTIRNIGYADALVSVLSLQTAMFLSFGEGKELDAQMMNGITGAAVCAMILFIGVRMMYTAHKKIKYHN